MKRNSKLAATILVMSVIASACGSDSGDPVAAPDSKPVETTEADPPADTGVSEADPPASTEAPTEEDTGTDESMQPVVIGYVLQTQGPGSFAEQLPVIDASVKYLNAEKGGVDGHPLEVRVCETDETPESNQGCAQELANDDDVDFVIYGGSQSGSPIHETLAAAGKHILGPFPATGADLAATDTTYYGPGVLAATAQSIAAVDAKGINGIKLLLVNVPLVAAASPILTDVLDAVGAEYEVVMVEPTEPDLIGAVSAANIDEAESVIALLFGQQCLQLVEALDALSIDVPVFTSTLCLGESSGPEAAATFANWSFTSSVLGGVDEASGGDDVVLLNRIMAEYGDPDTPLFASAPAGFFLTLIASELGTEIGFDNLSADTWRTAVQSYVGPVALAGPSVSCPGPAPFVSVCSIGAYQLVFTPEGTLARDGDWVDPAVWLADRGL